MMVFDDGDDYKPQTYLSRIKRFAEDQYPRSIVHQDRPSVVLDMHHIRVEQASDRTAGSVQAFCAAHVSRRAEVQADACTSYAPALAGGWDLRQTRSGAWWGDSPGSLPAVHHVFSNLKAKLAGTCHGVSAARLQEHLDEFSW